MTTISRPRRAMLATLLIAAVAGGAAGSARADIGPELVDLKVVDRATGEPLRTWRHGGRLFVAGQPGARYALRVTNQSDGRVLVVMSVDGVNILTGQTANYGQTGYVFDPRESYDVSGWRKSDTEVAAFTFAPLPQSYAARTGRPADVGVIGIAAFRERAVAVAAPVSPARPLVEPMPPPLARPGSVLSEIVVGDARRRTAAPPPPAPSRASADAVAKAEPRSEKLGTGHGARETSVVTNVDFERATGYPQLVRRIEYDSYDNLVALGVVRPRGGEGRWPRPFPAHPNGAGYVPDPPGGR